MVFYHRILIFRNLLRTAQFVVYGLLEMSQSARWILYVRIGILVRRAEIGVYGLPDAKFGGAAQIGIYGPLEVSSWQDGLMDFLRRNLKFYEI